MIAAVILYHGLILNEMGPLAARIRNSEVRSHANPSSSCPSSVVGHSMGAATALENAARCQGRTHVVVTLDPMPTGGTCPPKIHCVNIYGAGWPIKGARNIHVNLSHLEIPVNPKVMSQVLKAVR